VPNLKDVAARAGVSTATVSNVLTGIARVGEQTRERVLAAVRELDYHPDLIAQSLRKRSTRTLGMMIPDIANPFFPQLVRGAGDAAWDQKYSLIIFNTDEQIEREHVAMSVLRARRVDGLLVIAGPHPESRNEIERATLSGIPTVILDRKLDTCAMDCVLVDNRSAARRGVEEMIRAGCRRIAFISGPASVSNARERRQGYEDALVKSNLALHDALIRPGDYHRDSGYQQGKILMSAPLPPDGIFAANAMMAIGVLDALMEFPLGSADNVVIGHFDDLPITPPSPWTIVTVSQSGYEMGYQGARLLLDRISGNGGPERVEIRLQAPIRVRHGLARLAADSPASAISA
jgi:LacI family transcriptional regulator